MALDLGQFKLEGETLRKALRFNPNVWYRRSCRKIASNWKPIGVQESNVTCWCGEVDLKVHNSINQILVSENQESGNQ